MARELIVVASVALVVACSRDKAGKPEAVGAPLASKAFYRIDAGARPACASGTTCEVPLVLTALGDYHVNTAYPFKFVGDPEPAVQQAVQIDGTGSFALSDAQHGTLTVKLRPAAPGTAKLVGVFKLSVCSDDTCEIETPKIELAVPVS